MEKISFKEQVYCLCKQIPSGKVTTYKAIADALGIKSPQAVGQALRCNPYAPIVPCHRVIRSDGAIGGFKGRSFGLEVDEKRALLIAEGVRVLDGIIDLKKFAFSWDDETIK